MSTIRSMLERLESSELTLEELNANCYLGLTEQDETRETARGHSVYRGKVRELVRSKDELWIYHSDRLTAFDRYIGLVPYKGVILAQISAFWFDLISQRFPTHFKSYPHDRVIVSEAMRPFKVEVIVRGYLAGSIARAYKSGVREFCGVVLPEGLQEFRKLDSHIITPTTKADAFDHDVDTSSEELISSGVCSKEQWDQICQIALRLFDMGQEVYREKGWILVDTKYEFGLSGDGSVKVIDEVHTPDSSRLWVASDYHNKLDRGEAPQMLDKENVRRYLIEQGFKGEGRVPQVPSKHLVDLARVYLDVAEILIGRELLCCSGDQIPFPGSMILET